MLLSSHFADEEMEATRGEVISSRSHRDSHGAHICMDREAASAETSSGVRRCTQVCTGVLMPGPGIQVPQQVIP